MKKTAIILIFLLVFSLTGCAKQPDGENSLDGPENLDVAPGYWQLEPVPERFGNRPSFPGEEALNGVEGFAGVVAYLGAQEDGDRVGYLCLLEKNAGKNHVLAAVLLSGTEEFRIEEVKELDLSVYAGPEASSDAGLSFAEGWTYTAENPQVQWDAVLSAIWNRLNANMAGTSYRPVALLGTHKGEEGTSWAVLCDGSAGVNGPLGMFVATMNRDAEGKVSFGAITRLDAAAVFDGA